LSISSAASRKPMLARANPRETLRRTDDVDVNKLHACRERQVQRCANGIDMIDSNEFGMGDTPDSMHRLIEKG
jgi:hypothetical protein